MTGNVALPPSPTISYFSQLQILPLFPIPMISIAASNDCNEVAPAYSTSVNCFIYTTLHFLYGSVLIPLLPQYFSATTTHIVISFFSDLTFHHTAYLPIKCGESVSIIPLFQILFCVFLRSTV